MKKPPYSFILEALAPFDLQIKPMFGASAVFHDDTILMIFRKKSPADENTGVWFGIPEEFILDIKKEFPILKDLTLFGDRPTVWQVLRESEPEFEKTALAFCQLMLKGDERVGRLHKAKSFKEKKFVIPKKIKVKDNQ